VTATLRPIADALGTAELDRLIEAALAEDIGSGDVTSEAIIPLDMTCRGKIVCRQDGVIAGLPVAQRVFELVDERLEFTAKAKDGSIDPKLLHKCNLPLTGAGVVDMVITDLGVFDIDRKKGGMMLTELAPGVTVDEITQKTQASFKVDAKLKH